jgi:flagellar motor protein MotB
LQKARPFLEAYPDLTPLSTLEKDLSKKWQAKVRQVEGKVVVEFPGISFYGSAATDVNEHGQEILRNFAKLYIPFAGKHILTVVGFADSRPVMQKHRYNDNLELSVLRSVSALRALQTSGIPLSRIRLGGYGVSQSEHAKLQELVGSENDDDVMLSMSRKVVLIIEPESTP